ncbi:MAG TPA: hypothetical protein VN278_03055 [Methanosarcina sp.]|nr:hypothetical protein [Methanosarcina sp.]
MDKVYEELQFAENEFFRAYSLALKAAGSNEGTITLVEKIRTESDLEGSRLYTELQDGIKAANMQASQSAASDFNREQADKIEKNIEFLRKKYATKRTAVLEAATIQLRTIALGRF